VAVGIRHHGQRRPDLPKARRRRVAGNNWRNCQFHPAAAAGLGRPRPYELRHAFASLLIREQRTSIVELAEQLGHAPTLTLSTYTHVFREHRRSAPLDVTERIRLARRKSGTVTAIAAEALGQRHPVRATARALRSRGKAWAVAGCAALWTARWTVRACAPRLQP
jgi:hypothetical protein